MTDPAVSGISVDLMGDGDSIDPRQWAMHGLLTVYFRYERSREQAGGLQPHSPDERTQAVRHALRRRTLAWPIAGLLATAAVVGFAVFNLCDKGFDVREIGFATPVLAAGPTIDPTDTAAVDAVIERLTQDQANRDEALRVGDDPWLPWTQIYRHLRALGRWEEALSEAHAFVEYARQRDIKPDRYSMYYSGLFDLGNIYAAIGNYETAWDYHERSLAVARDYQEWYLSRSGVPEDSVAYARAMASTLVPRLSALSILAVAQGDMRIGWQYHNEASALLADYFWLKCTDRGLNMNASATLVDFCASVVADGDIPHSLVVKVREHLLCEARLHRLDHNLESAEQTLDTAAALPDYPFADESRLDFNEPMERLRITIARGEFVNALAFAIKAEANTGARQFEGRPTHPPIGIVARAELQFLRGVALAGMNRADPEAVRLIDASLDTISQAAASLSSTRRERFSRLFEEWTRVRKGVRLEGGIESGNESQITTPFSPNELLTRETTSELPRQGQGSSL